MVKLLTKVIGMKQQQLVWIFQLIYLFYSLIPCGYISTMFLFLRLLKASYIVIGGMDYSYY